MDLVWTFIEESEGGPAAVGLELMAGARRIASRVEVLYLGSGDARELLGAHGASRVFQLKAEADTMAAASATAAIAQLIEAESPDAILFALTYTDRDVAGRLSARLRLPVISNAVAVDVVDDELRVVNEVFGGKELVETRFETPRPHLVIVRPKSFTAQVVEGRLPEAVEVELADMPSGSASVLESHSQAREGPQLEEAAVIVSGGRGLGAQEHYRLIEDLAAEVGAATGATRAIVDSGWVPYNKQVGQTGKTVKPDVYIACGISGAMQHLVGMKDSKVIIAVNKDPDAPIFGIADLGVVGDVHNVLPKLIEAIRKRD